MKKARPVKPEETGKVKANFFVRVSTKQRLENYKGVGLYPGKLIDLVFSDEKLIERVVAQHLKNARAELAATDR